jgi:hypothetical protein
MNELDTVVLAHDIGEHGLKKGDVGVIVHIYENGKAFVVEFVTTDGKTVAVLTLNESDVRPMGEGEILHVRELSSVSFT